MHTFMFDLCEMRRMGIIMINKKNIDREQALYAIENGEFGQEVIGSKNIVIVIMTQDWCPQWTDLRSWVYELETDKDIDIYELEYNKTDYFEAFMNFKEIQWVNYNVPYLRFYKNGALFKETNYISRVKFLNIIEES